MTNSWLDPFSMQNEAREALSFWYKNGVCSGSEAITCNRAYDVYVDGGTLRIAASHRQGVVGFLYIDTLNTPKGLGKAHFVPLGKSPYALAIAERKVKRAETPVAQIVNAQAFFSLDDILQLVERKTKQEKFTFGIKA
jgi:hypothetical protein